MSRLNPILLAALAAVAGCDESDYALQLSLYADGDALRSGNTLVVQVADLQSRSGRIELRYTLGTDLPASEPVEIPIELHGYGEYHAHVVASGPDGVFSATRCYWIGDRYRSEVLLADALDDALDPDLDTWPVEETCRERGQDGIGCLDQCPPVRSIDCNEHDADVHPGARDVCGDNVDQNCNGVDSVCDSEDETGGFGEL